MKAKVFVSALSGFFFGLIGYFIFLLLSIDEPFQLSVVCGSVFALLILPAMVVIQAIAERRYAKFEKEIHSPIFYQTGTLIALDEKTVRNGKVYFCEAGILLVNMDEKPYLAEEIPLPHIARYDCDSIHLNIITHDGRALVLTFPNIQEAITILRKRGWIQ